VGFLSAVYKALAVSFARLLRAPAFARASNGGLIVLSGASAVVHRGLIMTLATRHRVPAVYPFRVFVTDGGPISYRPDSTTRSVVRPAMSIASSRARSPPICRCTRRPSTNLVINLKTAKALGIDVPATVLARADTVFE